MAGNCGKVGLAADAWVAFDNEAIFGTKVGPGALSAHTLFSNESMKGEIRVLEAPTISASHSDSALAYIGSQIVAGEITVPYVYEGLGLATIHAFGSVAFTGAPSNTFSRVFDLATAGRYQNPNGPSLTVHISRGIVGSGSTLPSVFSYAGCVVDSLGLACSRDGPLLATFGFFGREESLATSAQAVSLPTAPVANGTECTVTWGGVEIPVFDWSISMRRNVDRDRFPMGDTLACEAPQGRYEITAQLTSEWDNEIRAGSTTLRADYAARTARNLKFSFVSTRNITGTSQKWTAVFELPQAIITDFAPNVGGPGRVLVPISFKGYDDSTSATIRELRLTARTDDIIDFT